MISCIVPVHNGAAFLAEAIASILGQAGVDLEVIVVDDGSTDGSAEIAAGFDGVQVVRQAQSGVAAARNAGLRRAQGDHIAFLDADDLWLPGKLAAQLAMVQQHASADLCLTLVRHVPMVAGAPGAVLDDAPRLGRLMQCLLARRAAFDRVGGFDEGTRTRGDQDWFIRAAEQGLVEVVVPEVLVLRRLHGQNHSLAADSRVVDDFLTIAKRALDRRRRDGVPLGAIEQWSA
jgi:glycosyltransferase involved in cell wall biosynthesis